MKIPDSPNAIPYSATFKSIDETEYGVIEIIDPMIKFKGDGAVNHAVPPSFHHFSIHFTRPEHAFLEMTNDADGDEECNTILEIPIQQLQEMFDWLRARKLLK